MIALESRPLFRIEMSLHPVEEVGATPLGTRRIFRVSGGRFAGARLKGEVTAAEDWLLTRTDGAFQQDVRATLKTDDGALILMSYRGVRHASPEIVQRIARGETVDRSQYYLRIVPFFEAAAEPYAWLNRIVSVGVGERVANGVAYDVFEIL